MPQDWEEHWPLNGAGPEEAKRRDAAVHTLGNLTLTTDKLNISMSNQGWTAKRERLKDHSRLALNRELLEHANENWTVDDIERRADRMCQIAEKLWPIPN